MNVSNAFSVCLQYSGTGSISPLDSSARILFTIEAIEGTCSRLLPSPTYCAILEEVAELLGIEKLHSKR